MNIDAAEGTFTAERVERAERAAHACAVAETAGRPIVHAADKIEYARLLKAQGVSLGQISLKTGIPKTSLHRYLASAGPTVQANSASRTAHSKVDSNSERSCRSRLSQSHQRRHETPRLRYVASVRFSGTRLDPRSALRDQKPVAQADPRPLSIDEAGGKLAERPRLDEAPAGQSAPATRS